MKHIVLVSGGKDSTATLFKVMEENIDFTPVFCDTDWEHPLTYKYLDDLEKFIGKKIVRLKGEYNMFDILKNVLPNCKIRACNTAFKVQPTRKFIRTLKDDVILYMGIRKNESKNRLKKYEHYDSFSLYENKSFSIKKQRVYNKYPIIDWTEQQVFDYIKIKGFYINPLYKIGFKRVGCFPCICENKKGLKLCLNDELGRERIKKIIEFIDENYDWEYVKKISLNFYKMKQIYIENTEICNEYLKNQNHLKII